MPLEEAVKKGDWFRADIGRILGIKLVSWHLSCVCGFFRSLGTWKKSGWLLVGALVWGQVARADEAEAWRGRFAREIERIAQYARIVRWQVEQFAEMLRQMKTIREGDASLLDNSMILFGCGMSDGNRHDPNNLPILVAGRGGGTLDPGRHLASPKNTPLCNLHLALAHRMGLDIQAFGDSAGELKNLGRES